MHKIKNSQAKARGRVLHIGLRAERGHQSQIAQNRLRHVCFMRKSKFCGSFFVFDIYWAPPQCGGYMVDGKKKVGYTRKDLKARGWPDSLIREKLEKKIQNGSVYFLASQVNACEEEPEVAAILEQTRKFNLQKTSIRKTSIKERQKLAQKVGAAFTAAIQNTTIIPAVLPVVEWWYKTFLDILGTPYTPSDTSHLYMVDDLLRKLRDDNNRDFREKYLNQIARGGWVFGTQEDLDVVAAEYVMRILAIAQVDYNLLVAEAPNADIPAILAIPEVQKKYPLKQNLYYCYLTYFVPASISRDLSQLLAVDPRDEYPDARCMERRFYIHVGGTNTGKPYQSIHHLKEAASGVYLAPLRLLALEVQETLLSQGVPCSMLTGEEEDIREGATHISSTVGKLDLHRIYEVAIIDECQMISDTQRGFAWTRAILGVQAVEIHLCVAPEGLEILKRLLKETGEPYEVIHHERMVPLTWQNKVVSLKEAKPGDAFVAFSKRSVLQMAELLRKNGTPASIIYGALPYATRRGQMQRFLDGKTKVLVATDAIGMGLNLPIHRVIFTQTEKHDGIEMRPLKPTEVRQIAGRAGRYGIYDAGFATVTPDCQSLARDLDTVTDSIQEASLGFSDLVLRVNYPLVDVLRVWNRIPVKAPYVRMDISRYIFIISIIQSVLKLDLPKEDLLRAGNIPFEEKLEPLMALFKQYMIAYDAGSTEVEKPVLKGKRLADLENYYKMLDLYYSFSRTFHMAYDASWLQEEKARIAEEINHLLVNKLSQLGASCRKCGGPLKLNSPYGICEKCYKKQRMERYYNGF